MGFEQYHEPASELSAKTRTFAEFLLRRKSKWREITKEILFQPGDIVAHGEEAEEETPD